MSVVKSFDGKMIDVANCIGCIKAKCHGNININPGEIIRTKNFDISQDFELPINGFIVIGSLRHVESINDMTKEEKSELLTLIDVVIMSLKKLKICSQYNVVWEEKDGNHFHVWLMPRHNYLTEAIGGNIVKRVAELFEYAKNNLRTEENINQIYSSIEKLKIELKSNEVIKDLIM